jgi:hypothetical protein
MGDRRSPSLLGHITPDIRVIIAHFFGPTCGDDHPYINRSACPDAVFDRSNISEANEIAGSQLGSQRRQTLGYARLQSASICAAKRHIRPHLAPSGDRPYVPSKQRDAGSNPARRTNRPGQSHVPILKDRAGSPTGSRRNSFPL